MKVLKILGFFLIFGTLLFVAVYHEVIREHGLYYYYAGKAPEYEELHGRPGAFVRNGGHGPVFEGSMQGYGWSENMFTFSYRSVLDPADRALYYEFRNEGDVDIVIHSDALPMMFGLRHLELEANESRYFRVPGPWNRVRDKLWEARINDRPCGAFGMDVIRSPMSLVGPDRQ